MTAQICEYLKYRGEGVNMCTEPLESYFDMRGYRPNFMKNSTALHRGYVGAWEIAGGRLYLVKLTAVLETGRDASIESVFPGFPDRVFAHWYTGTVRIPRGDRLKYVHGGYGSIYELDEMLEFERGVVRKTWVRNNVEPEVQAAP